MSHLSKEKLDLLNRTKKIVGQVESVERALEEDAECADVLQRLAAARGAYPQSHAAEYKVLPGSCG
jgi:FrmR/RcnR family transcriptional regulator, repressor of frmRAB operon